MSAREEIINVAERLLAEHGVNGISLREINKAAGQRNATAIQYHFRDRDGLLLAIVERHIETLSQALQVHLDELTLVEAADPAAVVGCLAEPLFELAGVDGGAEFLQIAAQLLHRETREPVGPANPVRLLVDDPAGSLQRWARQLAPLMHPAVTGGPLHQRFALLRFAYLELGRRLGDRPARPLSDLFKSHLVDLLVALAVAAPSPRTLELLQPVSAD